MFPYQIIQVTLDAIGNETERSRAWSFETRQEAIQMMQNLISRHHNSGYSEDGALWWGTALDGTRMRYLIEGAAN